MFFNFLHLLLLSIQKTGYIGITLLMTIESTFIPYPSEAIIPPAAYLAQRGDMNLLLVILTGVLGSLIGAAINYYLAFTLGRKAIYYLASKKVARIFLVNEQKIKKAEDYFLENANISTFIGRLIPGIRHLISIPAGFSKMPFWNFIGYTFAGSFLWVSILAFLGYFFGQNQELLLSYLDELWYVMVIIAVLFIFYLFKKYRKVDKLIIEKERITK